MISQHLHKIINLDLKTCTLGVFSQEPQHATAEVIIDVLILGDEVTIHNPMILENYFNV